MSRGDVNQDSRVLTARTRCDGAFLVDKQRSHSGAGIQECRLTEVSRLLDGNDVARRNKYTAD